MSTFFRPYEGKRPYVFISYSHRDSDRVLDILTELNDRKLRLWYDEGIPAGSDWPINIETHMRECAAVLFFLSRTALASQYCYSEIQTAIALKKPILAVRLDDAKPDMRWLSLLRNAELLLFSLEDTQHATVLRWGEVSNTAAYMLKGSATIAQEILRWKRILRSFYRNRTDWIPPEWVGAAIALLLLLATAVGLHTLIRSLSDPDVDPTPAFTPVPTATGTPTPIAEVTAAPTPMIDPSNFPVKLPDSQQDAAVRNLLGKGKNDDILRPELAAIKELYFCGHMTLRSTDGIVCEPDGTVKVGASTVITGKVGDLSVIGTMVFLERLALIDQPLRDLTPLNDLVLLKELWLSGSALSDVSDLTGLISLETLHLEHTQVKDLKCLETLPSLRVVTVSADMLPLTWTEDKPFRVILVP